MRQLVNALLAIDKAHSTTESPELWTRVWWVKKEVKSALYTTTTQKTMCFYV